jgi:hypothetical protein
MDHNPYESPKSFEIATEATVPATESVIVYNNTFADIVAFYRHTYARTLRNHRYFTVGTAGILAFGVSFSLGPDMAGFFFSFVGAIGFTLIFGTLYHALHPRFFERQIRRILDAGSTEGVLGRHELKLDGQYLVERTNVSEGRQALSAIDRIEDTEEYVFVYLSAVNGLAIPKSSMVVGDADQFLATLRRLLSDSST